MGKSLHANLTDDGEDDTDVSLPFAQLAHGRTKVVLYGEDQSGSPGHSGGGTISTTAPTSAGSAGAGLTINISWDASVASAPVGFTDVVTQVVQNFQAQFSDPITINIAVGYGEVGGRSMGGALGSSLTYLSSFSYLSLKSALAADATTAQDASAVASLPGTDPTGGHYWVSTAEGKALGLIGASTSLDGYVGFSSSAGIFDYNDADGVTAGKYDFYGVVAHEISEVMGRILLTGGTIGSYSNSYDVYDLFHFSAPGVRTFSGTTPGYFSVDNGATSLNTFNTIVGGDFGDWAGATVDPYNAYGTPGVLETISNADLLAMDAIGWNLVSASPPPPPSVQPDLTAGGLTLTVTGSGTTASFNVNNIGTDIAPASTTGIYLSTDTTITTADTLIGSFATASLGLAGIAPGSALISLPTSFAAGTYYIGAYADSGNAVAELSETNNASNTVAVIIGNNSANTLTGTSGADMMFGLGGNDTLTGGAGNDTLIGGAGGDHFRFNSRTDGIDKIVDFAVGADVIDVARNAFGNHLAIGNQNFGTLDMVHFIANDTGAMNGNQKFWFNTTSHTLYYDADGSGTGAPVAVAQFDITVTLHNTDIHIV